MTIDDLAAMVAKGFTDIEEKIDTRVGGLRTETKADFAALNKRIDGVQQSLSYKVDQLDAKLDQHRQETKDGFAAVHRVVGGMSHTLTDHEERIKELEGE